MGRTYRGGLAVSMLLILVCSSSGLGEQGNRGMKTIGILQMTPMLDAGVETFKRSLTALGYREGVSIQYVYRNAHGSVAAVHEAARELAALPVDLFFTFTTASTAAARAATIRHPVPIIFTAVLYPQDVGLVERPERPGGWITGTSPLVLASKQLEMFVKMVPQLRTLGVIYTDGDHSAAIAQLFRAAQARQLVVQSATVRRPEDVQGALRELLPVVDALYIPPDNVVSTQMASIVQAALAAKVPVMSPTEGGVEQGALLSYAADYQELARFAADMAHKVLQGEMPANIPVEYPVKPKFTVNLRTSRALGLPLSSTLLYLADAVIE